MALLRAERLKKSFGTDVLFSDVSFAIESKDRIGLVGDNGCGKTTLLKVLLEESYYEDGVIQKDDRTVIGYMEQHVCRDQQISAFAEVLTTFSPLMDMEERLECIQLQLRNPSLLSAEQLSALIAEQSHLNDTYVREGGLTYRSRTRSVLQGLGFDDDKMALPVMSLSGGQKAKLQLAKLLLSQANLLLLDEPTNHLDIAAVEWLESFLLDYSGAFVVISHDRYFLDKVTTQTWEIEHQKLTSYKGNYSRSRVLKEEQRLAAQRRYDNTKREIDRLQGVVAQQRQWNREKNIKTAESKLKVIERLENSLEEVQRNDEQIRFDFTPRNRGGNDVLQVKDLSLSFGQEPLFQHVNLHLRRGERVFLLGPNGCGKTSLFKTILGQYTAGSGSVRLGANIDVGYYDQIQEGLDPDKTILDTVWDRYPMLTETELRSALARFLFKGDDVFKLVGALSGGERARVLLLELMMAKDNFLMLDEPTNHLDIKSCEMLEDALRDYSGTLFLISHDRYLINQLATRIVSLSPQGIREYSGNYDDYLKAVREEAKAAPPSAPKETAPEKQNSYKQQKENKAELRKLRVALRKTEDTIERLEGELAELEAQLSQPEIASDYGAVTELTQSMDDLRLELDLQMEEWAVLSERIDGSA
ncbi:MAG: ABC-F family ATP-binding cassette domain-containing protein [Oscillospiraceae bacterium]|nr:ABC-F family ATP-binding cassette domain-containing protein [Oscillospiraceae bacterium]